MVDEDGKNSNANNRPDPKGQAAGDFRGEFDERNGHSALTFALAECEPEGGEDQCGGGDHSEPTDCTQAAKCGCHEHEASHTERANSSIGHNRRRSQLLWLEVDERDQGDAEDNKQESEDPLAPSGKACRLWHFGA